MNHWAFSSCTDRQKQIPFYKLPSSPGGTASSAVNPDLCVFLGPHLSLMSLPGCDRMESINTTHVFASRLRALDLSGIFKRWDVPTWKWSPESLLVFSWNGSPQKKKQSICLPVDTFTVKVPPGNWGGMEGTELGLHLFSSREIGKEKTRLDENNIQKTTLISFIYLFAKFYFAPGKNMSEGLVWK